MNRTDDVPALTPVFELAEVSFRYPGSAREVLRDVSLQVSGGALHAILGPNGSGKSTLLRVMLGELSAQRGSVAFDGRAVGEWPRRALARRTAFVPQAEPLAFPLSVRQLVEMGRYPHVGILGRPGREDESAIEGAMARAGVSELSERSIHNLSGGERQRARIARALAQEPTTLVLDEPTAALDLRYEMETFELMSELAQTPGFTVVVATHNLNLAARYASELVLLSGGQVRATGSPPSVLTHRTVEDVYGWPVAVSSHPGPGHDEGAPQVLPLSRP